MTDEVGAAQCRQAALLIEMTHVPDELEMCVECQRWRGLTTFHPCEYAFWARRVRRELVVGQPAGAVA